MTGRPMTDISIRFGRKVFLADSGCFEWAGACNEHGYGVLGRGRRGQLNIKAHRLSYEIFNDTKLDSSVCVCHRCDNPRCVNPQHLYLGTQQENLADMFRKKRNSPPPLLAGTKNPKAKLDAEKVQRAFSLRRQGLTTYQIADELGVCRTAICSVLNRKTWRSINVTSNCSG